MMVLIWPKRLPRLKPSGSIFTLALFFAPTIAAAVEETYGFDKGHSEIVFKWDHVGISTQSGEFFDFDGKVVFDRENIEASAVEVTINVESLETGVPSLNTELKGTNHFDGEQFPEITFKSTSVRQTGMDSGQVEGSLTIRGISKPVILDVWLVFEGDHPLGQFMEMFKDAHYLGFAARTRILRSDFGMSAGVPLVSDRIDIEIVAEMRRKD